MRTPQTQRMRKRGGVLKERNPKKKADGFARGEVTVDIWSGGNQRIVTDQLRVIIWIWETRGEEKKGCDEEISAGTHRRRSRGKNWAGAWLEGGKKKKKRGGNLREGTTKSLRGGHTIFLRKRPENILSFKLEKENSARTGRKSSDGEGKRVHHIFPTEKKKEIQERK